MQDETRGWRAPPGCQDYRLVAQVVNSRAMLAAIVAMITAGPTVGTATMRGLPLNGASIAPINTTPIRQEPIPVERWAAKPPLKINEPNEI